MGLAGQRSTGNGYSLGVGVGGNLPSGPGYVVVGTITTTSSFDCLTCIRSFVAVRRATEGLPAVNANT